MNTTSCQFTGSQISVRSSHSESAHYFYGPLYLHSQSIRTLMLCCPIGTNMFPEVCERMTKELTASVPYAMKIIVVARPDGNIFTVCHCAEVLLQCKDSSLGAALTFVDQDHTVNVEGLFKGEHYGY